MPRRSSQPYATHIPVLLAINSIARVENVLELGCGEHSTATFLDHVAFPRLRRLESLENDAQWYAAIRARLTDRRLHLRLVSGEMRAAVAALDCIDHDVVFVDDSTKRHLRAATLREVVRRCGPSTIVVVHDFESREYQRAANGMRHVVTFDALNPNTGVAWNDAQIDTRALKAANRVIRRHRGDIEPADVAGWLRVLRADGR